jgi:2,4-didehydro-3-deoxy-L-rhamnonate hydrolase
MKLVAFSDGTRDQLGLLVNDNVVPVFGDPDTPLTLKALLAAGSAGLSELREFAKHDGAIALGRPVADVRLIAPVGRPGKIVAIGRNYVEHVAEEGATLPSEPLVFAKFPSSVVGPDDDISWDEALTTQVDYEAELAIVIGAMARNVDRDRALDYVLGYTCLNDVSARDLQFGDGQWVRGKSLDTFAPIGPCITTVDELGDGDGLRIRCSVNGEVLQDGTTSDLIFGVRELVSRLSASFTLEPGDVIASGTPPGVGAFRVPPRFLGDGDEVVVEIEGIGRLRNQCHTDGGRP